MSAAKGSRLFIAEKVTLWLYTIYIICKFAAEYFRKLAVAENNLLWTAAETTNSGLGDWAVSRTPHSFLSGTYSIDSRRELARSDTVRRRKIPPTLLFVKKTQAFPSKSCTQNH